MEINRITQDDLKDWHKLALRLWPTHSADEMAKILSDILESARQEGFIVRDDAGQAIAFMNLSMRYDYVPGAKNSPVAYIEGIYVEEEYRRQGIATRLIYYAEQWATERQCTELASDALIENTDSQHVHKQLGFREVERVVAFIKQIRPANNEH